MALANDVYLIPKPGLRVRDPATGKALPAEGAAKPKSSYWLRRLRDGDVSVSEAPKTATTKTGSKSAAADTTSKSDNP